MVTTSKRSSRNRPHSKSDADSTRNNVMLGIIWKIILGAMMGAVVHMIWSHVGRMKKKK